MVRRRSTQDGREGERPARNITGPQSALTDFLASHNISANRIRLDAEQRRQQALAEDSEAPDQGPADVELPDAELDTVTVQSGDGQETVEHSESRATASKGKSKKAQEKAKALEKIKNTKYFKKRKLAQGDDDDDIANAIFKERHAPMPGQMENCEICEKRFPVTPYSVAGPDGGLLCSPCGRKVAKEREGKPAVKKPRKQQAGGVGSRRTVQSRILDGDVGTKSLATLCVQTLAKNVDMADDLGDLPEHLIDKIARLFSKRRLLRPETLPLFVRPSTHMLHIYDGARLGVQELKSIFQVASSLRDLKIRNGIQFKDEVMDYLMSRNISLESFSLSGANLLSEKKWHEFLDARGHSLRTLQVYYTDNHFGDDSITALRDYCPNLTRLKIANNQKVTETGVLRLGELLSLRHLSLQLSEMGPESYEKMIVGVGKHLSTLSIKKLPEGDDKILAAIHDNCRSLSKLRVTDCEDMSDEMFVKLFTDWDNPPLRFIDFQKCRHVDAARPRENADHIGLCGEGFKALMAHSGQKIEELNIHACRHIPREAFESVFHKDAVYPELQYLEISFCEEVTDFVLGCIFRTCPKIKEVNVFGCMKVKDILCPRGVILVGVPNAQGMVTEGR